MKVAQAKAGIPFDVSIDLTVHNVPPGIAANDAVLAVKSAVGRISGASWISVEWCGNAPSTLRLLQVYRPGDCREQVGQPWRDLHAVIASTTTETLAALADG